MNREILSEGRFIRNAFLSNRRRVSPATLESSAQHDREVELVEKDTAHPDGHIYNEIVYDTQVGEQQVRLVRTTKPYNPDFITSAHTLGYLFPVADYSKRIVTPADGDRSTWQKFMAVNQACAETMRDYYRDREIGDFSILVGGSFNPYTDADILRTQTIKAAHIHTFLISRHYLEDTVPFHRPNDFTGYYKRIIESEADQRAKKEKEVSAIEEMRMDYRRYFRTVLNGTFGNFASAALLKAYDGKAYTGIQGPVPRERTARFPVNSIQFSADGLAFLSSPDFIDLIKTAGETIEAMYRRDMMPIFVRNYDAAIDSHSPEAVPLEYNDVATATAAFDEKIGYLQSLGLSAREIERMRSATVRLSGRLSADRPNKFNLGPTYAFSALYDNAADRSDIFISFTPFGGGTFDAMGFNKVWFPDEPKDVIAKRFESPASKEVEGDLFGKIQERLQ